MPRTRPTAAVVAFLLAVIGMTAANAGPGGPPPNTGGEMARTPPIHITWTGPNDPYVQVDFTPDEQKAWTFTVNHDDTFTPNGSGNPALITDRIHFTGGSGTGGQFYYAWVAPCSVDYWAYTCTYSVTITNMNDIGQWKSATLNLGWDDEAAMPPGTTGSSGDDLAVVPMTLGLPSS